MLRLSACPALTLPKQGVPWEQLNVGPGSTVLENNSIDNFMVERSGVASAVDPGSDTLFVFGGVVAETGVDGVTGGNL